MRVRRLLQRERSATQTPCRNEIAIADMAVQPGPLRCNHMCSPEHRYLRSACPPDDALLMVLDCVAVDVPEAMIAGSYRRFWCVASAQAGGGGEGAPRLHHLDTSPRGCACVKFGAPHEASGPNNVQHEFVW